MKSVHQAGGSLESEHGGAKVGSLKLESRKWDTREKGELIRTGYSREKSWDLKNNFLWPLLDFFFPRVKTLGCHHEHPLIITGRFVQCNPP